MTESELIELWESEKIIYNAWGECVSHHILKKIDADIGESGRLKFLQIVSGPRLKDNNSFIDKAFYRKKNYTNPYNDIKDKVGVRLVVLHTKDLRRLDTYINNPEVWTTQQDRDYIKTRESAPEYFGYEAIHYILEPTHDFEWNGTIVPAGTPCEVQLKTILQHAYSELAHDTIYKPQTEVTAKAKRYCAKAMALIEATDDYFLTVIEEIEKAEDTMSSTAKQLCILYQRFLNIHATPNRFNEELILAYADLLKHDWINEISEFYTSRPWLIQQIKSEIPHRHLVRQPAILMVLYFISTQKITARGKWPDTDRNLEPLYALLGENMLG